MLQQEAKWYQNALQRYLVPSTTLLNIGSSTRHFREVVQPHIQDHLFTALPSMGIKVIHVDARTGDGIDLVGDVTTVEFVTELKNYAPSAAICSNLLEHLVERQTFCRSIVEILPPEGLLFVSGPYEYPYHSDPIDNMFRPTVAELAAEFPGMSLVEGTVVDCGTWGALMQTNRERFPHQWRTQQRNRTVKKFLPFYKPGEWWRSVTGKDRFHPNQRISATCVVLRKQGNGYA
jgi:hypothetical protein